MRKFHSAVPAGMTAIVFAAVFAGAASAKCSISKTPQFRAANPALLSLLVKQQPQALRAPAATDPATEPSVVGYWYMQFVADGQVVDEGFDMWHSDGTEVLNDTTAPSTGNVCLGVWAKTGPLTYALKHPSWIFDMAGVNVIGVVMIREQITLDPSGNSYTGTSTFDTYDLAGNLLDHGAAQLIGQRITALDDPSTTTGIPGLPALIVDR